MAKLVVTIDGPAGVGKSTVSRLVAHRLGAAFLDTGAMYRALTLAAMRKNVDLQDVARVIEVLQTCQFAFTIAAELMKVSINGTDVTEAIREPAITEQVKHIAQAGEIRARLVQMQRDFARAHERIVTEGRDQGTVAFPNADFKFFLTAQLDERARRRVAQYAENGTEIKAEEIRGDMEKRDASDVQRSIGPLTPAEDAITIDTMHLDVQGVVNEILGRIRGGQRWTGMAQ